MRLTLDRFTWTVIGVVILLVLLAIVTVNVTGREPPVAGAYLTEDAPSTPVINAIVAVQQGDAAKARAQFSDEALKEIDKQGYDPIANSATYFAGDARRFRIVKVSQEKDDEAFVTLAEDNYSGGGLFERSTYTNERIIRVVREDGVWKVASTNLFY